MDGWQLTEHFLNFIFTYYYVIPAPPWSIEVKMGLNLQCIIIYKNTYRYALYVTYEVIYSENKVEGLLET